MQSLAGVDSVNESMGTATATAAYKKYASHQAEADKAMLQYEDAKLKFIQSFAELLQSTSRDMKTSVVKDTSRHLIKMMYNGHRIGTVFLEWNDGVLVNVIVGGKTLKLESNITKMVRSVYEYATMR